MRELADQYGDAVAVVARDICSAGAADEVVAVATDRFGTLDDVVNNAGLARFGALEAIDLAEFDAMFAVNVRGTWLCCRAVTPVMKEHRAGRIVNVSSMTVPGGIPLFLHYVASKAAIVGLTRALARELGDPPAQLEQPGAALEALGVELLGRLDVLLR